MIENLSDQEKSILLFKAMGWYCFIGQHTKALFVRAPDDNLQREADLYNPANMALSWRVLNWADSDPNLVEYHAYWGDTRPKYRDYPFDDWMRMADLWKLPAADAQRLWLDKILELAIEAGLIEVQDD